MNNWLDTISNIQLPPLSAGSHLPNDGFCAMEMVAFIERLNHSDAPSCTCPVIAAYVRGINDAMDNKDRQRLLPYLPRLVGTVSPEHEQARAECLAWHAITVFAPPALHAAGLHEHAEKLAGFDRARGFQEAAATARAAYTATHAANAANAADAAARAAYAANAADSAARAADAAADAAYAPARAAYTANAAYATARAAYTATDLMLAALDAVLAIGPLGRGFTDVERVKELITC
jgi:hypothetical protein